MATEEQQEAESKKSPEDEALERYWARILENSGLDEQALAELTRKAVVLDNSAELLGDQGPQTDEELWQWFRDRIGVELPRVAVCPGHTAPFEIVCDIHFFRILRLLLIAARGAGKTSLIAWLDVCSAETRPGFEVWTTGPGISQGERKYDHMLPYVVEGGVIGGTELPHVARSTLTQTIWKNGSKAGIGAGTVAANNGPRAPRLQRDELELMREDVIKQAGNIPAGRSTPDGRFIPAQIIDTSTMKWAHGRVSRLKEEHDKAVAEGKRPRMAVRIFCLYEIAEEAPNCRAASKEERETRLKELGKDPCDLCDCHTFVNDVWDESDDGHQQERTLEDVCAGRLFRSRGFKPLEDIQTSFLENDRETWEAEMECSQPSKEGIYIKGYSQIRCGVKNYEPHPDNGKIYMAVDWGGVDQHAVIWFQLTDRDLEVDPFVGDKVKVIPADSIVIFAEIFRAGIGNVDLGQMAVAVEDEWRKRWPGWRVHERYPDYQNAAGRLDWEKHLSLKLTSRIKKDPLEEIKYIRGWVGKRRFYVAIDRAPMFDKSIRAWREENGHEARGVESRWATHMTACIAKGALVETERGPVPIEMIVAGDQVWTRRGLKSVLYASLTRRHAEVIDIEHKGNRLSCTPDHLVWTSQGWAEAQDVSYNDILLSWSSWRSSQRKFDMSEKSLFATGSGSYVSPQAPTLQIETTSRGEWSASKDQSICIDTSGKGNAVRYLRVMRSITMMAIHRTTRLRISFVSRSVSIGACQSSVVAYLVRRCLLILSVLGPSQQRRWLVPRCAPSVVSTLNESGLIRRNEPLFASTATKSSNHERCKEQSFAQIGVRPQLGAPQVSTMRLGRVRSVMRSMSSIATRVIRRVLRRAEPYSDIETGQTTRRTRADVYDLEIEGCHEFFASGLLVHNCARYGIHNIEVIRRKKAVAEKTGANPADLLEQAEDRDATLRTLSKPAARRYRQMRQEILGAAGAEDSPNRSREGRLGGR